MPVAKTSITGRFAPSPSGPLHMGSLVMAIASYLDVKQSGGDWFIRIDDIDPPRSVPGSTEAILKVLADIGLESDLPIQYQSEHEARYARALDEISEHLFYCTCTRAQLRDQPVYPGTCRENKTPIDDAAVRINTEAWAQVVFEDQFVGQQKATAGVDFGDFIVKRRDGLWSYQFATAVDDGMDVTRALRGQDLLATTPQQVGLMILLGLEVPEYCHLPTLHFEDGQKLSKQHHAPPVEANNDNIELALELLGQNKSDSLIDAIKSWDLNKVPRSLKPFPRLSHDC